MPDLRDEIAAALQGFLPAEDAAAPPLRDAALRLLTTLGYRSDRTLEIEHSSPRAFMELLEAYRRADAFRPEKALFSEWTSVDLLCQVTDADLADHPSLFKETDVDPGLIRSYLFFAIDLKGGDYSRGKLSGIVRQINRAFPVPVLLLIRHRTLDRSVLSIAIINRRVHKRAATRDVLEKVSLIRDIDLAAPHRGHLDILASFAVDELARSKPIRNFDDLHAAWSERLNIELLNRRFYRRIQEWFFWAAPTVRFPHGGIDDGESRNRIALIRMLTRIVFCWFARQKGLIPADLFKAETARRVLKRFDPADRTDGGYYLAILQNLFFPTLAVPLDQREFRDGRRYRGANKHYMDHRVYRHEKLFRDAEGFGALFERIPFLNGGLFECLDTGSCKADEVRVDGFSDVPANQPTVPNVLFFGEDEHADLRAAYGAASKRNVKVDGLFHILDGYTFTVTENTPIEEEIALDPELLGRIFENLLAEVNPETERTARKETGSFYTPRAIVDYMAAESLKAYLEGELVRRVPGCTRDDARAGLEILFAYTEKDHPFNAEEQKALVDAVYEVRAFDPACGSGAFPMGMLQKLVFVLEKLDHDHRRWKARILADTPPAIREETRVLLERSSAEHNWKLALIQHSIYGADIQPIAVQIAKLRCFISLLVDFKVDDREANRGVPALPNLDFKFVAANTLIPVPGEVAPAPDELALKDRFFTEFTEAAERYFYVRDPEEKRRLRTAIERLVTAKIVEREQAVESAVERYRRLLSRKDGSSRGAPSGPGISHPRAIAAIARAEREKALWESYRNLFACRNAPVGFFDVRYFFPEVREGFDITIGNPPYVRADEPSEWNKAQRAAIMESRAYETLWEKWDLFVPFIERAYKLLRPGGISTLIVSDAFCHAKYAQKPQTWFLKNARILRLDFCSDLKIFDAGVHNLIYFFQRADGANYRPERRLHKDEFGKGTGLPSDAQGRLTHRAFFPEEPRLGLAIGGTPLARICYVTYGLRPNSDERDAKGEFTTSDLVADRQDAIHSRPYVEGKHLAPWIPTTNQWIEWGTTRAPSRFCRPTFPELYEVSEKIIAQRSPGPDPVVSFDDSRLVFTPASVGFIPWHLLEGVRNRSLKKAARYRDEKPPRPDLPRREDLEATSRRFSVKYLLAVMNSGVARDFLRAHRRSNIHLYPDDWKKLPIPDVDAEAQAPIIALVDRILDARRADPQADISQLEKEIDRQVAKLYGVTEAAS